MKKFEYKRVPCLYNEDRIEKLNQLKLAGILTEEEFSSKKADLLSKL